MVDLGLVSQVLSALSGAGLLGLASHTYRAKEKPAAASFAVLVGVLGITALCAGLTAHTGTPYKLLWLYTSLAIPLALAFFGFDYYGLDFFASRTRAAAAITPAVIGAAGGTAVILGTAQLSPGSTPPVGALATLPGGVFDMANTLNQIGLYYTTAVMLVAVGLVLRTVYRYEHLDGRLGPVIAFVGVWPWVAYIVMPQLAAAFSLGIGLLAIAVGYAGSAVVAAVAVGPLELFASSPAAGNVGPDAVLDSMEDAVVVADDDGHVLRMNAVACETFETSPAETVGGPLSDVVGHSLDALGDGETVSIDTREGARQFAVTRTSVTDRIGGERGYALVLRDVTRRQTREQRLEVLNRVLRHNLRNDATSIIGRAQLIGDGGDPVESAERIVDKTTSLVSTAERAREIERMMSASETAEATSLQPVLDRVLDDVTGNYPDVEVTTALPEDATADVSPTVLEIVLRNVVENAAEHNDADEPIVVVSGDEDDESLTIAVADNGPGIPEHERDVLDTGEEDQLQHGSGLGMWAAQWGVTKMGGQLSFAENNPRGSVVTISVPTERGTADPPSLATDGSSV